MPKKLWEGNNLELRNNKKGINVLKFFFQFNSILYFTGLRLLLNRVWFRYQRIDGLSVTQIHSQCSGLAEVTNPGTPSKPGAATLAAQPRCSCEGWAGRGRARGCSKRGAGEREPGSWDRATC